MRLTREIREGLEVALLLTDAGDPKVLDALDALDEIEAALHAKTEEPILELLMDWAYSLPSGEDQAAWDVYFACRDLDPQKLPTPGAAR